MWFNNQLDNKEIITIDSSDEDFKPPKAKKVRKCPLPLFSTNHRLSFLKTSSVKSSGKFEGRCINQEDTGNPITRDKHIYDNSKGHGSEIFACKESNSIVVTSHDQFSAKIKESSQFRTPMSKQNYFLHISTQPNDVLKSERPASKYNCFHSDQEMSLANLSESACISNISIQNVKIADEVLPTTTKPLREVPQKLLNGQGIDENLAAKKSFNDLMDIFYLQMECESWEKKKVIKKLESAFNECDSSYIQSMDFQKLIKCTMEDVRIDPSHHFMHIIQFLKKLKIRKAPVRTCVSDETLNQLDLILNESKGDSHTSMKAKEILMIKRNSKKHAKKNKEPQKESMSLDNLDQEESAYTSEFTQKEQFTVKEMDAENSVLTPVSESFVLPNPYVSDGARNQYDTILNETQETELLERKISSLKKKLKKCRKKIRSLQRETMSLDDLDQEESVYILECDLKEQCIKTWNRLRRLAKCPGIKRELCRKISYSGTKYAEFNEKIELMIKKKHFFPDFRDIYMMVKNYFKQIGLSMTSVQVALFAKDVFSEVGEVLSRRRKLDDMKIWEEYILDFREDGVPEKEDEELLTPCFEESARLFKEKMNQVLAEFLVRQNFTSDEEDVL